MTWSEKRKPLSIAFAAVIALGLVTYAFWPQRQEAGLTDVVQESPSPPAGSDVFDPDDIEASPIEPPEFARGTQPRGEAGAAKLRELLIAREPFPHDVAMDEYKAELWSEIQANPPRIEKPGDPAIDAEMAYRLYMYFGNCSMAPRTEQHLDRVLQRISERSKSANDRNLERLERQANSILDFYELCLLIPPDMDPRMEAITWMGEAVRLGHEIAEVQYYEKIMGFLLRRDRYSSVPPIAMQQPGMIEEFKAISRLALARAIEKGHPEAYLAMSQALFDGLLYPKDPVVAFAYARVAELKAAQSRVILDKIGHHKSTLLQHLDQEQLAEAEELAHQLRMESGG